MPQINPYGDDFTDFPVLLWVSEVARSTLGTVTRNGLGHNPLLPDTVLAK